MAMSGQWSTSRSTTMEIMFAFASVSNQDIHWVMGHVASDQHVGDV